MRNLKSIRSGLLFKPGTMSTNIVGPLYWYEVPFNKTSYAGPSNENFLNNFQEGGCPYSKKLLNKFPKSFKKVLKKVSKQFQKIYKKFQKKCLKSKNR